MRYVGQLRFEHLRARNPFEELYTGVVCDAGLQAANSEEFDKDTTDPVVMFMPEGSKTHM